MTENKVRGCYSASRIMRCKAHYTGAAPPERFNYGVISERRYSYMVVGAGRYLWLWGDSLPSEPHLKEKWVCFPYNMMWPVHFLLWGATFSLTFLIIIVETFFNICPLQYSSTIITMEWAGRAMQSGRTSNFE